MSERRSHVILLALIAAALVGVGLLAAPGSPLQQKPTLGLDLQGGLEVVLQATPPPGRQLRENDLNRSVSIIRNRIDKLGVAEPEVRKQGENQISVQLAGVKNADVARKLIGKTALLEFYDLEVDLTGPSNAQGQPVPHDSLHALLAAVQTQVKSSGARQWFLLGKDKRVKAGPAPTRKALLATDVVQKTHDGKVPQGFKVFGVPTKTVLITCDESARVCPGVPEDPPTQTYWYLFKYDPDNAESPVPEMTGEHLRLSGTRPDFDPQTREPIVLMSFTDEGTKRFGEITAREAQRGKLQESLTGQPSFQHFAIVLDREIQSFPQIDYNENPNGITGTNGAQITGIGSVQESKELAIVLQTGALPVTFRTLEETEVSATLGEDSLREAWRAAIAGLVVVALFLLIAYRFLGLVAVLGLLIYAAFVYAAILIFDVTLTLPGFAGMILTIGVAADANIVVFERIKEESRAGKSVRAAVGAGYAKGFGTIIDANVVTAITALVLFGLATAGVKGFALMLLIGTALSVVTAVFATRAMLAVLAGFRWFNSPQFMGAQGQQVARWLQHDYVGKRNLWFAISAAVLAVSLGSIALQGLNLGIDFRGGTEVSFRTPQPTPLEDVRGIAERLGEQNAFIQGRGEAFGEERYRQFEIRTRELDEGGGARLTRLLREEFQATAVGTNTVSASFGRQIAESAVYAILFSLLLVTLYITIRFQWKFALSTIVALLHDVLIAVGIYSLLDREVTTSTVAAILTVLGYSIYDSIIILDRVRENMPLMRQASFRHIGNVSLWETIRRSLATTFITLLPIFTLYVFGGETLKDFAFALLVGIGSGAYSSIFIAVPLVAVLKEREPDWRRRKETDEAARGDGALPVEEATQIAAEQPAPEVLTPVPARPSEAKRERRRQRRRARPHGRAR